MIQLSLLHLNIINKHEKGDGTVGKLTINSLNSVAIVKFWGRGGFFAWEFWLTSFLQNIAFLWCQIMSNYVLRLRPIHTPIGRLGYCEFSFSQ